MTWRDAQGNILVVRDRLGHVLSGDEPQVLRADLTDPLTPLNAQPVGHAGFGDPVFSDEFALGTLDEQKWIPWYPDTPFWNATTPGGHKTNSNEPQGYDETGIAFTDEGIEFTLRESNHAVPELDYTSGMICSYPGFNQTYGYFEASMRLADVKGAFPAFWMDRTDQIWPPEIDIMENYGRSDGLNHVVPQTLIWPTGRNQTVANLGIGNEVGDEFHVYGLLWEPTRIRWYVDGMLTKDTNNEADSTLHIPNVDFYLILNLAGDNQHIEDVVANAPFSITTRYVRAWALPQQPSGSI